MKNNFTLTETLTVLNTLSSKLFVRINRAGNIDVINPNRMNKYEHFVLYFTPNHRYLWRRWFSKSYCYPLNMKNRKPIKEIYIWDGKEYTYYKRDWNIINCEFETVDEALNYFKTYMKNYHNVNL